MAIELKKNWCSQRWCTRKFIMSSLLEYLCPNIMLKIMKLFYWPSFGLSGLFSTLIAIYCLHLQSYLLQHELRHTVRRTEFRSYTSASGVSAVAVPRHHQNYRYGFRHSVRSRPRGPRRRREGEPNPAGSRAAQIFNLGSLLRPKVRLFQDFRAQYLTSILVIAFPQFLWAVGRARFDQMAAAWAVLVVLLAAAQAASAAPATAPAFLWAPKNYGWVTRSAHLSITKWHEIPC